MPTWVKPRQFWRLFIGHYLTLQTRLLEIKRIKHIDQVTEHTNVYTRLCLFCCNKMLT